MPSSWLRELPGFDHAHLAAPLQTSKFGVLRFFNATQPQFFQQVILSHVMLAKHRAINTAALDQGLGMPFDEAGNFRPPAARPSEETMQKGQGKPCSDGRPQLLRAVDRTRQHRAKNKTEDDIKGSLLRQESLVGGADDAERGEENHKRTQKHLNECQVLCFDAEAQRVHAPEMLRLMPSRSPEEAWMDAGKDKGKNPEFRHDHGQTDGETIAETEFITMKLNTLQDLFIHELKDLYSAETQLVKALPKMAKAASAEDLQTGFEEHLEQTKRHVSRLDEIAEHLGCKLTGHTCKAMQGLIKEGGELISEDAEDSVRDAGLIGAAQRVEHYEIAGYGTARALAKLLGHDDAVELLGETLEEEKETDEKLTELAESAINAEAADARD